jgi:predicted CXXCH cytochrome family protein
VLALVVAAVVIAVAVALVLILKPAHGPPVASVGSGAAPVPATYLGGKACAGCHAVQAAAWKGSHHDRAMQEPTAQAMLGDFDNAEFKYAGVTSRFFRRDGKYIVRTDGPDGKLADFEVKYTFGVSPLQQYLVELPGGRYQALSIAWDARPKAEGGERWFHLYPNERIDHKDPLHWTGIYQNWNLQCAACHSTNLRKGYDAASNTYKTTFSEINVACEACHGPGSRHVEWAKSAKPPYQPGSDKGFVAASSRWSVAWNFPASGAKVAQRDKPAADALMNVCSDCHARRSTIAERGDPAVPLEDTHRLALLTAPNYYADGQQREEVYVWSSFLQTEMYRKGVTCMDCHDAHSLKLRAEGNALCTRCHNTAVFDTEKHHFHKAGTPGAQCVECHMPARNYMVIDARRDHGIRVPRPDLSLSLGSPNACTQCHADRKPEWAAAGMDQWYGKTWRERPHYGTTLHAAATHGAKALPSLLALARNPALPAIVRASAATLAQPYVRPGDLQAARRLLADPDPATRIAALGLIERFETPIRVEAGAPLLSDPVRGVRVEAARMLADVPEDGFSPEQRRARELAAKEYVAALTLDADWPAANASLGNLYLRQGRVEQAVATYERALALDPRFAGAYVNLADAYRQQKREADSEKVLRRGLALLPREASLHHALGLALVRKNEKASALKELAEAARLAPDNARYAYVYAVGLHSAGKNDAALSQLRAADARHPYNLEILGALVSMNREARKPGDALPYARKIAEILPDDPAVKRLVAELEGSK